MEIDVLEKQIDMIGDLVLRGYDLFRSSKIEMSYSTLFYSSLRLLINRVLCQNYNMKKTQNEKDMMNINKQYGDRFIKKRLPKKFFDNISTYFYAMFT